MLHKTLFLLMSLMVSSLQAMEFSLEALFPGKAMINLDGKRMILKAGQEKKGILLISTDTYAQTAEFEVNNVREIYAMSRQIGGGYQEVKAKEVMIRPDVRGNYLTQGLINGKRVDFLVDTGASSIALSQSLAKSLGINYQLNATKIKVKTASAIVDAYQVKFDNVAIEGIKLTNVDGIVIPDSQPIANQKEFALLGMSFLGRLELEQKQNLMLLRQNF
jgi:aspartyl protease family protein